MKQCDEILNELKEIGVPTGRLSPETPYTIPAGYFEQLSATILSRLKSEDAILPADELEVLSPLLKKMSKSMPFSVPDDYFEKMPANNFNRVDGNTAEAKVITVPFAKRIIRYSAAAAVAGIIAAGSWFLMNPSAVTEVKYANAQDISMKMQNLSESEMDAYLQNNTTATVYQVAPTSDEIKDEDVKLMLADVSDEELQHYAENENIEMQVLN